MVKFIQTVVPMSVVPSVCEQSENQGWTLRSSVVIGTAKQSALVSANGASQGSEPALLVMFSREFPDNATDFPIPDFTING